MRPNMGLAAAAIRPFVRNIQAISIGPVEQIELVVLDDADEPLCVIGRRSITGSFEPPCPTLVIGRRIGEQRIVSGRRIEKLGMVAIRILDRRITAETFALGIVVVVDLSPRPIPFALDAEMVIRLHRQAAVAAVGFEDTLRQRNAGRNPVTFHIVDGNRLVTLDVLLARLTNPLLRLCPRTENRQDSDEYY